MRNLLKGKKATLGDLISLMVAGVMIFFFLLFYFISLSSIGVKEKVTGTVDKILGKEKISVEDKSRELALTRELVSLMNAPVEFEGKEINVKELITNSLDPYIDEEIVSQFSISDINELNLKAPSIQQSETARIKFPSLDEQEKTKILKMQEVLRGECREYVLKIPQAYAYNMNGVEHYVYDKDLITKEYEKFDKGSIKLNHKGYDLEIKYWRNLKC